MAQSIQDSEDLWQLCDYLNKKRRAINDKYDYRYSVLIFVFARLLREGWITIADLDGISADKQQKIEVLAHWNPDK